MDGLHERGVGNMTASRRWLLNIPAVHACGWSTECEFESCQNSFMKRLRVFVASPSDVAEERDVVSVVVAELRRILPQIRPVELEVIRWETHGWPDVGADAQDVINKEIGEYDIFVGVMWRRFGTPTKRGESGTAEEFDRAYKYFKALLEAEDHVLLPPDAVLSEYRCRGGSVP